MNLKNIFKRKIKQVDPPPVKMGADMTFKFKDTKGVPYYHNDNPLGQSIEHFGKAMDFSMLMSAGLNRAEFHGLIDVAEKALEDLVSGKKGNLAIVGWVLKEMKLREELIIHSDLLINYMACFYYRHDEPVDRWISQIHDEKVEAFKLCVQGGNAYDFFQIPELMNLTAFSSMSPQEWNEHWNASTRELKNLQRKVDYLKSEQESMQGMKTSKKASL